MSDTHFLDGAEGVGRSGSRILERGVFLRLDVCVCACVCWGGGGVEEQTNTQINTCRRYLLENI